MPTYQYACTDCADRLEVVQKFTDDSLTVCPACDGRLRKIFSPVGIVFKGSGFYRNDSRSSQKSTEPAAAASNGSDSKSNGSDSKKTDAAVSSDSSSSSSPGDKSGTGSGTGDKKSGEKVGSSSSSSSSSSSGSKVA